METRGNSQPKKTLSSHKNTNKVLPYLSFQTAFIKLSELLQPLQLVSSDALLQLLKASNLFTKNDAQTYHLKVNWPIENDTRELLIVGNKSRFSLDFYYANFCFLTLTCLENNEILIEKDSSFKTKSFWSDEKINDLVTHFNAILRAEKISYQEKPKRISDYHYSQAEFAHCINEYQTKSFNYKIQNVIINNAYKKGEKYSFHLHWNDSTGAPHLLKANFTRNDHFTNPTANQSGYSWFIDEETLLNCFPDYAKTTPHKGQYYYSFQILEKTINTKTKFKNKTDILNFWMTNDGQYGELRHVQKGEKISGNEVLTIYKFFDGLFQIQKTFICDASRLSYKNKFLPLRLISALATGKTWYEAKLSGVKLFDCRNFYTVANGVITQNSFLRNTALIELQQLPLKKWITMLPPNKHNKLLVLYKKHLAPADFVTPKKFFIADFFSTTSATIKDLAFALYLSTKKNNKMYDLNTFCDLLGMDSIYLSLDINADDYWIKSRIQQLLQGSTFWIKEQNHHQEIQYK